MNLFQTGCFQLHSRKFSLWKIECDALTDDDISTIALILSENLPLFGEVEGVPTGGLRLAEAMRRLRAYGPNLPLLIVDDVFTTGGSMEEHRNGRDAIGAVIFARADTPDWISPLWRMRP